MDSSQRVTVICPEKPDDIFAFATRCLENQRTAILVRCPENFSEIGNLARGLDSATLLSTIGFLGELPRERMRSLSAGKLRVVAVLQTKKDDERAIPCLLGGCSGFLHLDDPPELWERAISAISMGELWAPRRMLSQLFREMLQIHGDSAPKITRRESEILQMIGLGYDNRRIATELFISKETVRWHLRSLYSKIGAADREGAMRFWRLNR